MTPDDVVVHIVKCMKVLRIMYTFSLDSGDPLLTTFHHHHR
jgi:hypothetical protein